MYTKYLKQWKKIIMKTWSPKSKTRRPDLKNKFQKYKRQFKIIFNKTKIINKIYHNRES